LAFHNSPICCPRQKKWKKESERSKIEARPFEEKKKEKQLWLTFWYAQNERRNLRNSFRNFFFFSFFSQTIIILLSTPLSNRKFVIEKRTHISNQYFLVPIYIFITFILLLYNFLIEISITILFWWRIDMMIIVANNPPPNVSVCCVCSYIYMIYIWKGEKKNIRVCGISSPII
jgi:hypothetical protein